jgi:hypothetical protein
MHVIDRNMKDFNVIFSNPFDRGFCSRKSELAFSQTSAYEGGLENAILNYNLKMVVIRFLTLHHHGDEGANKIDCNSNLLLFFY